MKFAELTADMLSGFLRDNISVFNRIAAPGEVPTEAITGLLPEALRDCLRVTTRTFCDDLFQAMLQNSLRSFHHKYIEAPLLILDADEASLCKSALEWQLMYILSNRTYRQLPTFFVSEKPMYEFKLNNDSLAAFMRGAGCLR